MTPGQFGFQVYPRRPVRRFVLAGALLAATGLVAACDGGASSPTAAQPSQLRLAGATVSVAGEVVNGMTVEQGHGSGASTMFRAHLAGTDGMRVAGGQVTLRYQRPAGMGMMGASGSMPLYDDGTHGDPVAGDGEYCYEDFAGEYGCHVENSPMGQYHYEFWGTDPYGHHSNHMTVTVTVD